MADPLSDPLLKGLQNVLDLRMRQHGLVSSNLANQGTPGFHAKSVDFGEALRRALDEDPIPGLTGDVPIVEFEPSPDAVDGNSVVPEAQAAMLQENAILYRAVTEGVARRLAILKFATTGGR